MNKPKISIKITNGLTVIKSLTSKKTKRIYHFLKAGDFKNSLFSLCITYKKGVTNRGVYKTKMEVFSALKAFLEVKDY